MPSREVDRVVEVVLLEKGRISATQLTPLLLSSVTPTAVRRIRHARHAPQGKDPWFVFVVGEGQAELLQVVGALSPAGGLTRRLHGGQEQARSRRR